VSATKILYGFHAVGVRVKTAPASVIEIYYDASRRDARMRSFVDKVNEANVRLIEADGRPRPPRRGGAGPASGAGNLAGRTTGRA
jgi:23S rRNA (guanosine2251-2'-O)-methyltransferase